MDRYQYLALMAGCLLVTLPLEVLLRARVYRRPRRLLLALAPVLAVFVLWDLVAIHRHHWDFNPEFTTGWLLPGSIPVEEVVFFVVIPICGLLTYEAVSLVLGRTRSGETVPEYTVMAATSVVAVVLAERTWLRTGLLGQTRYWVSMAIVLFFMVLVDGWLTLLPDPIVRYYPDEILGWRVPFDIPVEDYLFGFSLVTLTLLLWVRAEQSDG